MPFPKRPVLMAISDRRRSPLPVPATARLALAGGADLFQIREKDMPEVELEKLVQRVIEETGAPRQLLVNGQPGIAEKYGIGLHLPERFAVDLERLSLASGALLGRSVHADSQDNDWTQYDFVIAGHVFPTSSKPGLLPLGLSGLREIVGRSPVSVLAIGGISPENVHDVLSAGVRGVAVMSSISATDDPRRAAEMFRMALDASWERENGRRR